MNTNHDETPEFGTAVCDRCHKTHEATYSHEGRFGEGPIYAVVCDDDDLTDYYTTEAVRFDTPRSHPTATDLGIDTPVVGSDRTRLLDGLASVDYLTRLRDMATEVLNLAESMVSDDVLDDDEDPVSAAIDCLLDDTHEDDPESPAHAMTEDEFDRFAEFLRRTN